MDRGFVILAQNTQQTDYVRCAKVLEASIKRTMPNENVTIITELPYGDLAPDSDWKLINDWQVYQASPYQYTIKLEADMIIPKNIDYWWDILKERDVVVCSSIRNYKNELSSVKFYRQFIVDNNLPDVYNAITYFKKSNTAEQFFDIVRDVFTYWNEWKRVFKCDINEIATTDWAYAIACHLMGTEKTTLPFTDMSFIHMKQMINDLYADDWTKELVYELTDPFKVSTIVQNYPFHYHIKEFSKELEKLYENS